MLVFQILDQGDKNVLLKQEKKEDSLMKKGKKKFSLYILAIMFELFSICLCDISYVEHRSEV